MYKCAEDAGLLGTSGPDPQTTEKAEGRKDDKHGLEMQFAQQKQQIELERMKLQLEQERLEHQIKMQTLQQKQIEVQQAQQEQQMSAEQQMPQQPQMTDDVYKNNMASMGMQQQQDPNAPKMAAYEDQYVYGPPPSKFKGRVAPAMAGALVGSVGANFFPGAAAEKLFETANQLRRGGSGFFDKAVLNARSKGIGANWKRTAGGAGGGLLAGLLLHELID